MDESSEPKPNVSLSVFLYIQHRRQLCDDGGDGGVRDAAAALRLCLQRTSSAIDAPAVIDYTPLLTFHQKQQLLTNNLNI